MPGMYQSGDYDLAGFAVGAVERTLLLPQPTIVAGDVLIGLPSSGLHSNGFSLVRKIIAASGLSYSSRCPWDEQRTIGQALLEPTRIYVQALLPIVRRGLIKGMSHITGGGFTENIPRVLPHGLGCSLDVTKWALPEVFKFLRQAGNVAPAEMARTFNNGVGMVLIVAPGDAHLVSGLLKNEFAEGVFSDIGRVTESSGLELLGLDSWLAAG